MSDNYFYTRFYSLRWRTVDRMRAMGVAIWCGPGQLLVAHGAEPYGDCSLKLVGGVYNHESTDKDGHALFVLSAEDRHADELKVAATNEEAKDEPVQ